MLKTETYLLKIVVASIFLLLNACATVHNTETVLSPASSKAAMTFVFTCSDGLEFVARTDDEKAWLFLPSGTRQLPRDKADSYRDDRVLFQVDEQEASLEIDNNKFLLCKNDRREAIWEHAKLNGADYRAIGNEPGWHLELHNRKTIILITDYGSTRNEYIMSEPETDEEKRTTIYQAKDPEHEMKLTIYGETCRDSMSGEEFSSKAVVTLDGKTLQGCGRALH